MSKVINSNEFEKDVLHGSGTVLVDFYAEWCGPCKMIAPVLEELDSELKEKAKIFKVDVDKSNDLAQKYEVMGVPTLIIFNDGKAVEKMMGFQPKQQLKDKLEKYM